MAPPKMGTARRHWFYRGMVAGLLITATLNALSFFVRTHGWGGLLGRNGNMEAIGFPAEFWRLGEYYGRFFIDIHAMFINVAFALVVSCIGGALAVSQMRWLNPMVEQFHRDALEHQYRPFQFSIGTLMLATVPVAILFAVARVGGYQVLAAIYLFGPLTLVILAMLPRGLSWDSRVILLTPMAVALIGFATWIGYRLGIDFDKVLMGIFACWVPQSATAALVMTMTILVKEYRRFARTASPS